MELSPCPFCGGCNTVIHNNGYWSGMRTIVTSVEVRHYCDRKPDQYPVNIIKMCGRDEQEAILKWNTRK